MLQLMYQLCDNIQIYFAAAFPLYQKCDNINGYITASLQQEFGFALTFKANLQRLYCQCDTSPQQYHVTGVVVIKTQSTQRYTAMIRMLNHYILQLLYQECVNIYG